MTEKNIYDGSIVFRPEKGYWCATVIFNKKAGAGEGLRLGSILLDVIAKNEDIKKAFVSLMQKTFEHMVTTVDPESALIFVDKKSNKSQ